MKPEAEFIREGGGALRSGVWHTGWRTHRFFGLDLSSDFPFVVRSPGGQREPNLRFTCTDRLNRSPRAQTVYTSSIRTSDDRPALELDEASGAHFLRVAGIGEFELEEGSITCRPWIRQPELVEIALLGTVLALWLELRGIPAIHASAVEIDGSAVAFMAGHQGGKSSLAAAFLQMGHALISDDISALGSLEGRIQLRPSYPQMRMWPRDAAHFLGSEVRLRRLYPGGEKRRVPVGPAGFGRFCAKTIPLVLAILPERDASYRGPIVLEPVGRAGAVVELTRHSFLGRTVHALGLAPGRFDTFAEIARQVSFQRLRFPAGFEFLPGVEQAVIEALRSLPGA